MLQHVLKQLQLTPRRKAVVVGISDGKGLPRVRLDAQKNRKMGGRSRRTIRGPISGG